jgi:tol-pal system protein YbgF
MRSILAVAVIAAVATPAAAPPVMAQSVMAQGQGQMVALAERVDRLQRDVDVLQVRLARSGGGGNVAVAQAGGVSQGFIDTTETRFARLERQVQELTGRMEELGYRLEQLTRRMERMQGDSEQRQQDPSVARPAPATTGGRPPVADDPRLTTIPPPPTALGGGRPAGQPPGPRSDAGPVPLGPPISGGGVVLVPGPPGRPLGGDSDAQPTSPRPGGSVAAAPAAQRPEEQYEAAYALVREVQQGRGDNARAEQAMREFIQANPNHRLAGEARYWAGEMAFRRRDYRAASGYFAEGLERSRNGPRAPDTMLALARTLAAQNQREQACLLLGSLNERYPRASQTVKTQATRERERLRCA